MLPGLLIIILNFSLAFAKSHIIISKGAEYTLSLPDHYVYHAKFMGLENVFVSKFDKTLGTSSLSVTITGLPDPQFNSEDLKKSQHLYQNGRKQYLLERKLQLVDFIPYQLNKSPQGHSIHSIGVVYTNGINITLDKSYMIECPTSFIHSKFLADVAQIKDKNNIKASGYSSVPLKDFEKAILGLTCNKLKK